MIPPTLAENCLAGKLDRPPSSALFAAPPCGREEGRGCRTESSAYWNGIIYLSPRDTPANANPKFLVLAKSSDE